MSEHETWWMKLEAGELDEAWEEHLRTCPACAREWAAWQKVERVLPFAPAIPPLPADFAVRTAALVLKRRRLVPFWLQLLALLGFAGLSLGVLFLMTLPAVGRWLYLVWVFGPGLARVLEVMAQFWQAWQGVLVPVGLILVLTGLGLGVMPWITAWISATLIYCRTHQPCLKL